MFPFPGRTGSVTLGNLHGQDSSISPVAQLHISSTHNCSARRGSGAMQSPKQQVSQHGGLSPRVSGGLWVLQEVLYKVSGVLQEVLWILKILVKFFKDKYTKNLLHR